MNWIDVTKKTPPQNTPVLFYSRDLDAHLVGYWSEYDNCMVQYPDDREGWKWSVSKWAFIDKSDSPTCTANERKFLDGGAKLSFLRSLYKRAKSNQGLDYKYSKALDDLEMYKRIAKEYKDRVIPKGVGK